MSKNNGPDHIVVDGSNIATEGRSLPSLAQLNEAVMAFMDEYPDTSVTVVVDATFGHRIDKKESKDFEDGIANNELVAPPAGAVGRGDAFVLGIADKAGASVLSNDSFQEFHGEYEWLFDEGRLIGGKPVPHVGWVWVDRVPVRGPVSRKATGGKRGGRGRSGGRSGSKSDNRVRTGSKEASEPMPTPKTPPPSGKKSDDDADAPKKGRKKAASKKSSAKQDDTAKSGGDDSARKPAPKGKDPVNELMPFLDFVETHPVGTAVEGVVDAYSSHGAYVTVEAADVRAYIPLPLMAQPTPRSAKTVMKIGETVDLVVVSFVADRRSIDCAVPGLADEAIAEAAADGDPPSAADESASAPKKKTARKKAASKKTATKKAATKKAATKKVATKKTAAKKAGAKKAAAKKAASRKSASKKTAAKKAASKKKAAAKKSAAKKTAAKKTAAKKTAAKKTAAEKAAAKKTATKKAAAKKSTDADAKREATRKRRLAQSTGSEN